MTATLYMYWRFENGTTLNQDFATDGEFSSIAKEIASHMEIVDGGAAFWRAMAGDLQRENLDLLQRNRDLLQELELLIGIAQTRQGSPMDELVGKI